MRIEPDKQWNTVACKDCLLWRNNWCYGWGRLMHEQVNQRVRICNRYRRSDDARDTE